MSKRIYWSDEARADLRALDRHDALRMRKGLYRLLETGAGDIKQLHGFRPPRFRPRVGDWRIIFCKRDSDAIEIVRVLNRKYAYR